MQEMQETLQFPIKDTFQSTTVSVVIPALNEAENLPHVIPFVPDWVHEVILVDGHSTDGTAEVARQLRPDIRIVQQIGRGKGAALRTGFAAATGEIIVMLDADGSTDPREIPAYVGALLAGADFAKGSRFLQGGGTADMSLHRRLGNLAFTLGVRVLFGGSYSDLCYGYNAFWASVLPKLDLDGDGFEIETMMNIRALRAGFKVAEVPSFEFPRVYGVGRLQTFPDGWRVLKTIYKEGRVHHFGADRKHFHLFKSSAGSAPKLKNGSEKAATTGKADLKKSLTTKSNFSQGPDNEF